VARDCRLAFRHASRRAGGEAFAACEARGAAMLDIAITLDQPPSIKGCERPEPIPPVD